MYVDCIIVVLVYLFKVCVPDEKGRSVAQISDVERNVWCAVLPRALKRTQREKALHIF